MRSLGRMLAAVALILVTLAGARAEEAQAPGTLDALKAEVADLHATRKYPEATAAVERYVSLALAHHDARETMAAMALLTLVYETSGRSLKAEPLYRETLALAEKTLGPEHPDLRPVLEGLASSITNGKPDEAEQFLERSLTIGEKAFGADQLELTGTLDQLADLWSSFGKHYDYNKAGEFLKRALAIRERKLGREHAETGISLYKLARLHQHQSLQARPHPNQSHQEEAEKLFHRALVICEKALGTDHPKVGYILFDLGMSSSHRVPSRDAEAQQYYKRAYPILKKIADEIDLKSNTPAKPLRQSVRGGDEGGSLWPYKPMEATALGALPTAIREKLIEHLTARLGEDYYRRLAFLRAWIVDPEALKRVDPVTQEVYAYRAVFSLSNPANGIEAYIVYIDLNANGEVMEEIGLPSVRRSPKKASFVPFGVARQRAASAGLTTRKGGIDFSKTFDAMVYVFTDSFPVVGALMLDRRLLISAHTGEVLQDHYSTLLW